jgi:hypothetical protein
VQVVSAVLPGLEQSTSYVVVLERGLRHLRGDVVWRKSECEGVGVFWVVFRGEIAAVLVKLDVYGGSVFLDVDDGALEAKWVRSADAFLAEEPVCEVHRSGEIGGCHGRERGDEE